VIASDLRQVLREPAEELLTLELESLALREA
jgi:hypothetical protein